jgi:ribosomal protein S18 acetylase RimI-like enzyme
LRAFDPTRPRAVTLRPIDARDLAFLAALYANVREPELAAVAWPAATKAQFLLDQFRLQHQHYRAHYLGAEFLLIERHGEPIGRVYLCRTTNDLRLMEIALLDAHRGSGIGSALLAELIAESDISRVPISLHVEADNPAQRLFARHGFRFVEDRGAYQFLRRLPVS